MLPAAPRLHEARGRAPWALDWGGPHLLTALGTGGVVVDWTIRGGGAGSPKGLVHHLLLQFFTVGSSKMEVFETCFFDIVTT